MREIQWSSVAEADYNIILEYIIENFSKEVLEDFSNKLLHTLYIILKNPLAFRSYKKKSIRKCVINSQLTIYYLIEKDGTIFILTLFGKQNPATLIKIIKQLKK